MNICLPQGYSFIHKKLMTLWLWTCPLMVCTLILFLVKVFERLSRGLSKDLGNIVKDSLRKTLSKLTQLSYIPLGEFKIDPRQLPSQY